MSTTIMLPAERASAPFLVVPAPLAPTTPSIVVAADGREDVRPALRFAASLADRLRAPVRVLAAVAATDAPMQDYGPSVRESLRRRVRESAGDDIEWPVEAVVGGRSRGIAAVAAARHAELVLMGTGWRDRRTRASGAERALDVASSGVTPVLAVGREADGTFRRAVVALDFGEESVRAATLACRLLSPRGTLSLVHVKRPLTLGGPEGEAWDARCSAQIADLSRRLVAVLRDGGVAPTARDGRVVPGGGAPFAGRRDVTIGTVTLVGEPVTELLTYVATVGADLVAIGRHAAPRVADPVGGGLSAALARRVLGTLEEACVLLCPAAISASHADTANPRAARGGTPQQAEWRLALDGLWRRNAGRRSEVCVDDGQFGSRPVVHGYTLVGASYDPDAGHAELTFGDPTDRAHHLTRAMADVRAVAVATDRDGRDHTLRVEHAGGRTVLTFLPDAAA